MLVSTVQHFLDLKADFKVVGKKDVSIKFQVGNFLNPLDSTKDGTHTKKRGTEREE